jgi:hypothetical protein
MDRFEHITYNELLNKRSSDKGTRPVLEPNCSNGYAPLYDMFFAEKRLSAKNICEIGVEQGRSLAASAEFFCNAKIHGLDIDEKTQFETGRIKTYVVDQGNEEALKSFVGSMKASKTVFDVVIDDGSHDVSHQQLTFGFLWELLAPGGLYIIEDIGSSFFREGAVLYGLQQTADKVEHNTHKFLTNRPFSSPWISKVTLFQMEQEVDYVIIFDKVNRALPYFNMFPTVNNYGIRSITSIIKKKS